MPPKRPRLSNDNRAQPPQNHAPIAGPSSVPYRPPLHTATVAEVEGTINPEDDEEKPAPLSIQLQPTESHHPQHYPQDQRGYRPYPDAAAATPGQPPGQPVQPYTASRLLPQGSNSHQGIDEHNGAENDETENPVVFQCSGCLRLLGDSLSFIRTDQVLRYVTLSATTPVVRQRDGFETSTEHGPDRGSTFSVLECAGCFKTLGRIYLTTPRHLDSMRDAFSISLDSIISYQLGTNSYDPSEPNETIREPSRPQQAHTTPVSWPTTSVSLLEEKLQKTRDLVAKLTEKVIRNEQDIQQNTSTLNSLCQHLDLVPDELNVETELPREPLAQSISGVNGAFHRHSSRINANMTSPDLLVSQPVSHLSHIRRPPSWTREFDLESGPIDRD